MDDSWSQTEVDLVIADYLSMLQSELRGEPYNKTGHRRALSPLLRNRSDGSIERKHQNISAVMITLGYPYINGYKPLGNFQALLLERAAVAVAADSSLSTVVESVVDAPAQRLSYANLLDRLEAPPSQSDWVAPNEREPGRARLPVRINYLEREARNTSLGHAGELFVLEFERARLVARGQARLSGRVEHVSQTLGDGLGFDIRSFRDDGSDRLIEVKTTAGGKQTPFFVSRKEVEVSRASDDSYHLYRVFAFRRDPKLFSVAGALERTCRLEPVQFAARVA